MNCWIRFTVCALFALLLLVCGWLVPAHLRAVEPSVLKQAGRNTPTTVATGFELLRGGKLGAAEMISRAGQQQKLPLANDLVAAAENTAKQFPTTEAWGVIEPAMKSYFTGAPNPSASNEVFFTDFVVREENRDSALKVLSSSTQPVMRELLQTRALTNTTAFAPSQSPGGQAFDAAVVIAGILLDQGKLTAGLSNDVYSTATEANHGHSERLEQALLDFLSLGQRLNWGQLVSFVGKTGNAEVLHAQADLARNVGDQLPVLFTAVELSGEPKAVVRHLQTFPKAGLSDLTATLPFGVGGMQELLRSDKRFYTSSLRQLASEYEPFASVVSFSADYCWRTPWFALIIKWILYLGGGFLLAMAAHYARPAVSVLEEPLQVRGFHFAREFLFALGFLLFVLILSEPFLAQENANAAMPLRLRVPTAGSAVQPGIANIKASLMNQSNLLIMLLFFVLQALLYVACIVKLAEIRRQRVGPRVKLKLLENEEHLFDAGLYLGFLGTIVSFIIYSMYARHQFSLMVAYSSTSFGILFVSFFKIFHLRPARRRLLLEAEAETAVTTPVTAAHALPTS